MVADNKKIKRKSCAGTTYNMRQIDMQNGEKCTRELESMRVVVEIQEALTMPLQ